MPESKMGHAKPDGPLTVAAVLCAALSCVSGAGLSAQPTVLVLDSVVLAETEEDYLAWARSVTADDTGGYSSHSKFSSRFGSPEPL